MKKLLLITIILILQSFPSFGSSPNGKGLICKCYDKEYCKTKDESLFHTYFLPNGFPSEIGILFENDTAQIHIIREYNDKLEYKKEIFWYLERGYNFKENRYDYKFNTNDEYIIWNNTVVANKGVFVNRKTLELTEKYKSDREGTFEYKRKCEVFSKSAFFEKMDQLIIKYQKEHNKSLKDNKI